MDDSSRYLETDTLGKGLGEVAPLDLVVCLGGGNKMTPVGVGRALARWSGQGRSAELDAPKCGFWDSVRSAPIPMSPAS